mmetsp:Transcript_56171/g.133860  ORF Transcript_56171/g.133860 Transcript_56171/m.133860 type:complete len:200 (+) Transcript_56171:442-1041(+)
MGVLRLLQLLCDGIPDMLGLLQLCLVLRLLSNEIFDLCGCRLDLLLQVRFLVVEVGGAELHKAVSSPHTLLCILQAVIHVRDGLQAVGLVRLHLRRCSLKLFHGSFLCLLVLLKELIEGLLLLVLHLACSIILLHSLRRHHCRHAGCLLLHGSLLLLDCKLRRNITQNLQDIRRRLNELALRCRCRNLHETPGLGQLEG